MTNEQFSTYFDTKVNSYRRFKDFDKREMLDSIEFTEHEKSLYLTSAQNKIVVGLYNGSIHLRDSFEETEEVTDYLAQLVTQKDCVEDKVTGVGVKKVFEANTVYKLPKNMLFRVAEICTINTGKCGEKQVEVVPVTHDNVIRTVRNPFKKQSSRRVLRLTYGDSGSDIFSELISDYPVTSYIVRYLRKPNPIVLEDFPNDDELKIDGVNVKTECELNPALHDLILETAVKMALLSKQDNSQ